MKTTLGKLTPRPFTRNNLMPVLIILLALITSASVPVPVDEQQKADAGNLREKRLSLLEKLEKGAVIGQEEIRSSFGSSNDPISIDCCGLFSGEDIEEIRASIIHDLEILRHEIVDLRNSDEFLKAMDEVRKGRDEIRQELERMREEIRRVERKDRVWENV